MRFWERLAPIVVPLLIVIAVTEVLYFFRDAVHARHLVFFYLLPTAFVAMLYGSVLSMIVAIDATFLATFFLCDPMYTLYVSNPREGWGTDFVRDHRIDRSQMHRRTDAAAGKAPHQNLG